MQPLLERLAALTNGHDDVRLETAGRIAGRWFAAMDSDAGHELVAAGLLILSGPFDGDRLAGGLRRPGPAHAVWRRTGRPTRRHPGQDHHRRGRVSRYGHGTHARRRRSRRAGGTGATAGDRVRPATALPRRRHHQRRPDTPAASDRACDGTATEAGDAHGPPRHEVDMPRRAADGQAPARCPPTQTGSDTRVPNGCRHFPRQQRTQLA